ncbi:MAG TPA: protein kinase [Euzebya sp.]|nr:protein kinase [Euzebya sp.]
MVPATPADDLGIPGVEDAVEVGRGGFATVYRGRQPTFGRDVAVKVIDRRLDDQAITRFKRECLAIGQLGGHPAIVTVFEAGQTAQGRPYLLMPFHEAGSLQDRLDRGQPLSWQEACAVGIRLCSALAEAHHAGVLHRDIKPANVLVDRYGDAVLTDFGIARVAEGPETTSGTITASLGHAAPEILNGARPSAAADLYSLASTLYMLIAGHSAFHSDTDESVLPHMHRIFTTDPPDLGPDVPLPVRQAITRTMAKDPADRPADAVAFGHMLQEAQRTAGAPVTPLTGLSSAAGASALPSGAVDHSSPGLPVAVAPVAASPVATRPLQEASVADATVVVPPRGHVPPPGSVPPLDAPDRSARPWLLAGVGAVAVGALVAAAVLLWPAGEVPIPDGGPDVAALQPVHLPSGVTIDPQVRGLAPGEAADGTLAPGQADAYRFEAPEAGWHSLLLQGRSGTIDPLLLLFDADGSEILMDDDSAGGREGHDAVITTSIDPSAGPYTALVTSFDTEGEGEYSLRLEVAEVRELTASDGGSFSGQPGNVPAVGSRFDAGAGDARTVVMRSDSIDAFLELYATDGTLLASDDDSAGGVNGTDAQLSHEFDAEGEYGLLAFQFDWTKSGEWTLEVDR